MVRTCLLNGLLCVDNLSNAGLGTLAFITLVLGFICCCEVHPVRVYDFGLLLKIEGILMGLDFSLCQLSMIILAVV